MTEEELVEKVMDDEGSWAEAYKLLREWASGLSPPEVLWHLDRLEVQRKRKDAMGHRAALQYVFLRREADSRLLKGKKE